MLRAMSDRTRRAERCYVSTWEHSRTFYGKYVSLYTDKGSLELGGGPLRFLGKRDVLEITRDSIVELRRGSFARAAKPFRLDRIELTYLDEEGESRDVHLVPTRSGLTPTWKTNEIVGEWVTWLTEWRSES